MNIGKRLRELREAKKLSQGEIEARCGLLRSYISRVECGLTVPSLRTLERWAEALGVELNELFLEGGRKPEARRVAESQPLGSRQKHLLRLFRRMREPHQRLLLSLARDLARKKI